MPTIEDLERMARLVYFRDFNELDGVQRAEVMALAIAANQADALDCLANWFNNSRHYGG